MLAAGGIENPRLLLLSDSVQRGGLGNDRDQVGRYFMDHPHIGQGGRAVFRDPQDRSNFLRLYLKREKDRSVDNKTLGVWCLSEAAQRQERLQNFSMSIRNLDMDKLGELGRAVLETSATLRSLAEGETGAGGRSFYCRFSLRGEHGPNPDSRVTLSDERDRLGLRRAVLDWRLAERDARSMRRSVEVFCEEVAGSMLGRCRIQLDPEEPWSGMAGGDHHIGTTRMSADPATGVVDADCRVHGVSNLWVAGSSVFATCGMSNPTLTIVALALRLAGTLERELSP